MNRRPQIKPYNEVAKEVVINTINLAKETMCARIDLSEIAETAQYAWADIKLSLKSIVPPIAITSEQFIRDAIENYWELTKVFMYHIKYMGCTKDESTYFYYYEVIFSQPTAEYPIPQATASVFFRVEDKRVEKDRGVPMMYFRIEGHHNDFDVRFVKLQAERLLALIQMKTKFFKRIEDLRIF